MIEFAGVQKSFGHQEVLRSLTFDAPDGAVTGFVGPNGAGKSTAFKILLGLLQPDAGTALVDGARYSGCIEGRRSLGAFFGPHVIPGSMTGRGYLAFTADHLGLPYGTIPELLEVVGLADSATKKVRSFSLGMRQRLGIAAALLGQPRNLVLDEPVNGLDIEGVRWLRLHLRGLAAAGGCVLLSSHLLSELELVADRVVMLGDGRAVRAGGVEELRASGAQGVVVRSEDDAALIAGLTRAGLHATRRPGGIWVADATANQVCQACAQLPIPLISVARAEQRLEDVYLDQVGRDAQPLGSNA